MGRKPTQAASGQTKSIVTIRSSLRYYACTAVALLTGLSGRSTALSQQDNNIDIWKAAPSDLTLAITQAPPVLTVSQVPTVDSALTSTEQGHTMLEESFDYREGDWKRDEKPWKIQSSSSTCAASISIAATSIAQRNRRGPSADGWE